MTIKYNPFKASSILFAMLMFLYETGQDPEKEIDFEFDTKKGNEPVIKYYEELQQTAKKDVKHLIFPRNSAFRRRDTPLLLWVVSNEKKAKKWREDDSSLTKAAIIGLFGNLKNKKVQAQLRFRLSEPTSDELAISNLKIKGEALIDSGLVNLLEDKDVQDKLLAMWDTLVK